MRISDWSSDVGSSDLPRSGPCGLPLPPGYDDDATLERLLFRRIGRPPQNLTEPDWPLIAREIKRKSVTLALLWQEYRAAHPMVTAIPGFVIDLGPSRGVFRPASATGMRLAR